jgi:peptidoglycan/xylan/chitin deacetylase (PgdA/CDA1 family)
LYHRVDYPQRNEFLTRGGSPVITPEAFETQLRFFKDQGANFMTFADLRNGRFPGKTEFGVIVSFDDCFRDNYTNGLSILEDIGIKGVFFQAAGMIDSKDLIWEHLLYWLNRDEDSSQRFTDAAQRVIGHLPEIGNFGGMELAAVLRGGGISMSLILELLSYLGARGAWGAETLEVADTIYPRSSDVRKAFALGHEIGSHGYMHLNRVNTDDATFARELALSVEAIRGVTDTKPLAFSFPFNSYKAGDGRLCSKHFKQAATADARPIDRDTDPMWLPRFMWPGNTRTSNRQRRWLLTGTQ